LHIDHGLNIFLFFKFSLYRYDVDLFLEETGFFVVGLYTLNAVDPQLESARFQPLKLKCDILVSKICFQMQLVPLHRGEQGGATHPFQERVAASPPLHGRRGFHRNG
jgi:hypothetical protein